MSNFLNFAGNSGVTFKTFTASGGTTYTLDKSASTNSVLVSVGGVLQKPATDYSVSGTTLTTTSTVTTGIVIDTYIIHDAGNAPVIEDNSVTRGKLDLVSTSSAPGATIKGDGTTDGYIQLNCSQNSHGIKLKSPAHSAGASYTLTFPTTDGNASEFLQTNGSGVMTWAEAGGGWEFVSSSTASSSANIAFTNMVDGYDYEYVLEHVLPATDSVYMKIELGVSGPTYRTSSYLSGGHAIQQATSLGGNLTDAIHGPYTSETLGSGSGEGLQFAQLYLASPAVAANQTCYRFVGEFMDESVRQCFFTGGGRYNSAEAHTSVKFAMNSGNIASGRFFQYRRKRS